MQCEKISFFIAIYCTYYNERYGMCNGFLLEGVSIYVRLRKPLHIPKEVPGVHHLLVLIEPLNDEFDPER